VVAILLGFLTASRAPAGETPAKAAGAENGTGAIRIVRDIPYWNGSDPSPERHQLDLYLPADTREFPVVVFVHGGAWMIGDKSFFGWGEAIGAHFARQGIAAVMPSYRLAPAARNTDQVRDVARAVAWTRCQIGRYGGDANRLFLCGHSAGGQLVALLATDPRYLKAEGLEPSVLKGVVAVSGVFRAPEIGLDWIGSAAQGFGSVADLLGSAATDVKKAAPPAAATGPHVNLFASVFGDDTQARRNASPLYHVHPGLVPFLIFYAQYDLPTLDEDARAMATALKKASCEVEIRRIPDRDHETVMFSAHTPEDPVARGIARFVTGHRQ
jgi:acetyl esterase/lipase